MLISKQAKQQYSEGDKVSMSVKEGDVTCRKNFTVDQVEYSKVDNQWIYSLKTGGGVWKSGQFFRDRDLTLMR